MPVDPQLDLVLQMINTSGVPPIAEGTAAQARAGFRFMTVDLRDPTKLAPVGSVEETSYPAVEGDRPSRVYRPESSAGPVPTVLFIHGGGYVIGDLDTHDDQARLICHEVGAVVVSIDYRLAPEDPFPAGHLDCVTAYQHVVESIELYGGDVSRTAVAGDSAGGNLAAGVALAARDAGLPLAAQLLLYPGTDFTDGDAHASRLENAEGYFLTESDMRWFGEQYLRGDPALTADVRASILSHHDLSGVAPAIIGTAEFDPLRDEGEAYAAALTKAGVDVQLTRYPGMIHGFFGLGHVSQAALSANVELCARLKETLG